VKPFEIILLVIVTISSTIIAFNWKKVNWFIRSFIALSILLAISIGWNALQEYNKQLLIEKINASFGEIVDTDKARVPAIAIGYSKAILILEKNGSFGTSTNKNILKLYVEDDKLFLKIILRDKDGEVVACVNGNTWTIFDENYEYNNDDNAFEIVTRGEREVFFHIELLKGIAHVEGYLFDDKGNALCLYSAELNGKEEGLMNVIPKGKNIPPLKTIDRIFKYPREKYYSIREEY